MPATAAFIDWLEPKIPKEKRGVYRKWLAENSELAGVVWEKYKGEYRRSLLKKHTVSPPAPESPLMTAAKTAVGTIMETSPLTGDIDLARRTGIFSEREARQTPRVLQKTLSKATFGIVRGPEEDKAQTPAERLAEEGGTAAAATALQMLVPGGFGTKAATRIASGAAIGAAQGGAPAIVSALRDTAPGSPERRAVLSQAKNRAAIGAALGLGGAALSEAIVTLSNAKNLDMAWRAILQPRKLKKEAEGLGEAIAGGLKQGVASVAREAAAPPPGGAQATAAAKQRLAGVFKEVAERRGAAQQAARAGTTRKVQAVQQTIREVSEEQDRLARLQGEAQRGLREANDALIATQRQAEKEVGLYGRATDRTASILRGRQKAVEIAQDRVNAVAGQKVGPPTLRELAEPVKPAEIAKTRRTKSPQSVTPVLSIASPAMTVTGEVVGEENPELGTALKIGGAIAGLFAVGALARGKLNVPQKTGKAIGDDEIDAMQSRMKEWESPQAAGPEGAPAVTGPLKERKLHQSIAFKEDDLDTSVMDILEDFGKRKEGAGYYNPMSNSELVLGQHEKLLNRMRQNIGGYDEALKDEIIRMQRKGNEAAQFTAQDFADGIITHRLVNTQIKKLKSAMQVAQGDDVVRLQRRLDDLVDSEAALLRVMDFKGTQAGQAVQAMSLVGRMSPEGIDRFAMRRFTEAAEMAGGKGKKLAPPKLLAEFKGEADQITAALEQGDTIIPIHAGGKTYNATRDQAALYLRALIERKIPASAGRQISTIQTMAQLLNIKTALRNIIGNAILGGTERYLTAPLAKGIDTAIGAVTGRRTIKAAGMGRMETLDTIRDTLAKSKTEIALGVDSRATRGAESLAEKFGGAGGRRVFTDDTVMGRIFGQGEKALAYSLKLPDDVAFEVAYKNSLRKQMGRQADLAGATEEQIKEAIREAEKLTLVDENFVSRAAVDLKRKVLNANKDFGLGDLVLKYAQTPANLLVRGMEYSPLNAVNAVAHLYRGNQKRASEALARMVVGTGGVGIGYSLYRSGILTADADKKKKLREIASEQGELPWQINATRLNEVAGSLVKEGVIKPRSTRESGAGDLRFSIDWANPANIPFFIGALAAKSGEDPERVTEGILGGVGLIMDGLVAAGLEQPMVTGLQRFMSRVGSAGPENASSIFKGTITDIPASFMPSLLNGLAIAWDDERKVKEDPNWWKETLLKAGQRLPVFRQMVPAQVGALGDVQKMGVAPVTGSVFERPLQAMVNPAVTTRVKDAPELAFLESLAERTGNTEVIPGEVESWTAGDGTEITLSPDEKQAFRKQVGEIVKPVVQQAMMEFEGIEQPEELQAAANMFARIVEKAKNQVKAQFEAQRSQP